MKGISLSWLALGERLGVEEPPREDRSSFRSVEGLPSNVGSWGTLEGMDRWLLYDPGEEYVICR